MKINITKKEYRTLLEMIEIAHYVLFGHKTEEDPETNKFRELEQKFLSYAKDMGAKHLVTRNAKAGKYFITKEFEDKSAYMNYIDEYNNETFWDELAERLALRDLLRQEGEDKVREMSLTDRFQKVEAIRGKYFNEFHKNGINSISVQI